jgi:NADH-quinone oxidoreductase subunit I
MCADACPNSVIRVDFTKDEKGKRTLDEYNMSLGYCLFCGLCVKACPKDALNFKTDFGMTCYDRVDTTYNWKKPVAQEKPVVEAVQQAQETEAVASEENSQKGLGV